MGNNLGTQPVYGVKFRDVLATLFKIIGGSPVNAEQSKIDAGVKKIEKSQDEEYIKKLTEMVTSYKTGKIKPSKKIVQEYKDGKLKTEKGPNMKKAKMEIKEASKGQRASKGQKENGEREER